MNSEFCGDSTTNLPQAEITQSYFSDDSTNDVDEMKRMQVSIQYDDDSGLISRLRQKIREIVHNHVYQIVVITLVLLDAAIVVATILVDDSSKNGHKSHTIETVEKILHYISLTILSTFMLEIVVKVFGLGLSFFKHKLEVFDACVVIISFGLDVYMIDKGNESALGGVEFLILLRLWRISRIVNGIIVSVKKKSEENVEYLSIQRDELQEQIRQLEMKLTAQKKEITFLKDKLDSLGINVDAQPTND
eukprot:Seg4139.1 transcript_id=Seg4139.1/GoldUCD/mRNA.D3Y31 product="Voltage-gated hydrogen channel 1" protein_id=Seg4139.1/GoldUCD/D3Y31